MRKTELKKFRELYLEMRNVILKSIQNQDLEMDLDGDEVDVVQGKAIAELADTLSKRDLAKLRRIDSALRKIDDGSFGMCEMCDEKISSKRLEAIPGVEFCVDCAEEQEKQAKIYVA